MSGNSSHNTQFSNKSINKKTKYYAVKIGHHPGIYPNWEGNGGAKEQVTGYKDAVYKSFKTIEEAQVFMDRRSLTSESAKDDRKWQLQEIKRVKESYSNGYVTNLGTPLASGKIKPISDLGSIEVAKQLISAIALETLHPRHWNRHQGSYYIFTDGSYMPTSRHVGYGICLATGNNSSQNNGVSNCLHRVMPDGTTNNQCEMLAIASVLQIAWIFRDYFGKTDTMDTTTSGVNRKFLKTITIVSDSSYCINAISKWTPGWIKSGWLTADGKPVKNRELLEKINELWQQLRPYVTIILQHQNSHLSAPPEGSPAINRLLWEGNYLVDLAAKHR